MSQPQRFVILMHDHPVLHWDFMLDTGEVLQTWRLEREPEADVEIQSTALPAHRRVYLDYVGPVSGNRGTVSRWDAGTYSVLNESSNELTFNVSGEWVCGTITLKKSNIADEWVFLYRERSSDAG